MRNPWILLLLAIVAVAATPTLVRVHATPPRSIERVGSVTGWSIASDGSVSFRIVDLNERDSAKPTWFVTPPNRTQATQLERLVLAAVFALRVPGDRPRDGLREPVVTVRGDVSNSETGKSVAEAIPLVSITQG